MKVYICSVIAMVYCCIKYTVFKKVIFIANMLTTVIDTVKIEKLVVPEVVQSGSSSGAVLDCQFYAEDMYTVQWLYNHSEVPIYQWRPGSDPKVSRFLDGRLNLSPRGIGHRALHIVNLEPELSGEYTCRVLSDNSAELSANQTKAMLVYSQERDFILQFHRQLHAVEVKCYARGLYPQPDLTIELHRSPFPKQQQRVWRSDGLLYDAECTGLLPAEVTAGNPEVTCRLQLPQAGYTAIKRELLHNSRNESDSSSTRSTLSIYCILAVITYYSNY